MPINRQPLLGTQQSTACRRKKAARVGQRHQNTPTNVLPTMRTTIDKPATVSCVDKLIGTCARMSSC